MRATAASLDTLAAAVGMPILSISPRAWPADFPDDISMQRRVPYESRADSVMYRQVLARCARARGWDVAFFDAKTVEAEAASLLGPAAHDILHGPRVRLGPPWSQDHRIALATALVASAEFADA